MGSFPETSASSYLANNFPISFRRLRFVLEMDRRALEVVIREEGAEARITAQLEPSHLILGPYEPTSCRGKLSARS